MTEDASGERAPGLRTGRLEAFSDGVFAIAITLLVLEIAVPAGSDEDLVDALVEMWPTCLAYLVSFSTIGAVWFGHTVITEYLDHADSVLIRLNLLLLLVVSFHSFPTKLLADYTNEAGPERIAAGVTPVSRSIGCESPCSPRERAGRLTPCRRRGSGTLLSRWSGS